MAATENQGLGSQVAEHYNKLEETGLEKRAQSRIFHMRNFNNWIKSMAINDAMQRIQDDRGRDAATSVLDLGSGKGGDLLKWRKARIRKLVCADIAATSVEQCETRYKDMKERAQRERHNDEIFSAQFIAADCTKQRLKDLYSDSSIQFDLTSCQFSFHYGFESLAQAETILQNACECLRPGGYFIGTTPNSYDLVKRLRKSDGMKFGNDVYSVTFCTEDKHNLPLFGAKYDFHLEGVVDCPEFLVYFPLVEKMAEKYNMKLVYHKSFHEFFEENVQKGDGRGLLGRMNALEPYPAEEGTDLVSSNALSYTAAQATLEKVQKKREEMGNPDQRTDDRGRRWNYTNKVGTLSREEWEATSLYCVFAFQKQKPGGS